MRIGNGTAGGNGSSALVLIMKINAIEKHFRRGQHRVSEFTDRSTDPLLPGNVATSPKNSITGEFSKQQISICKLYKINKRNPDCKCQITKKTGKNFKNIVKSCKKIVQISRIYYYSSQTTRRRKPLQPQQRPTSRQEFGTGKKLPPTPTKPSNVILSRKPVSLPATPGRQLPRTRTPSEESYYKQDYNEDYNYAYRSSQDNLPQDTSYPETPYPGSNIPISQIPQSQSYVNSAKDVYPGAVRSVQDNQFAPGSYTNPQLSDPYPPYQETVRTQEKYNPDQSYLNNSYTDDYNQESYVPSTTQDYPDTYQTNTYPTDTETLDRYDNSRGKVIENNYDKSTGYNQNIPDYSQEPFKSDSYQSAYKQDSYQSAYKSESYQEQYKPESYPENSYQESYKDDSYQEPYQEPYKEDSYQEPYKEDSYQEPYKKVDDSYQDSFTDSYKQDSFSESYKDSYPDSYKQDSYPNTYKQDSFGESYKQDSYTDSYKQDSYQESFPDSYKQDSYQEPYKQDSYQEPYKQDPYEESYKQEPYKQDNSQYNGYNAKVSTSIYDENVPTSVYAKNVPTSINDEQYTQNQYDNKYNVTSSDYEQQQPYHGTPSSVPVSIQDNYQEPYREQKQSTTQQQDNYQDYQVPYSKEEDRENYKNVYDQGYQNYANDSYQESYDQYKDAGSGDRRQSEVPELSVTTPRGQTRTNGYQSSESEYFYPEAQNGQISAIGSARRKKLMAKRDTDSLESRDDELKDSFETAVSSMGSSQPRKGYSEYSTAGESSPLPGTIVDSPQSTTQVASTLANHVTSNSRVTITAMVHGGTAIVNGKRPLERTNSYQEDVIDDEEYPEIVPKESHRKDSQLSHQSQISQHSNHSQKPKLTRGDSYVSDHFNEDGYGSGGRRESFVGRKDSYASVNQEGFKPPLSRTDSYQKRELTRGGSYGQNFTGPQPISRAESCQRGYFKDQDSTDETDIVLSSAINGEYKMRDETLERYVIWKVYFDLCGGEVVD